MAQALSRCGRAVCCALPLTTAAPALAINLANIVGGQIVRMNYASDGVTVGGTYDFAITGLVPSTGTVGFLNVLADFNFDNTISPQEWIVQNIPMPLDPVLTTFPLMSTWFDPGPFTLLPGQPYRTVASLQDVPLAAPIFDPSWHVSTIPSNLYVWGGNDPTGQAVVFIPPFLPPPLPSIEVFKRGGVPDIAQQRNECGPTSAANSLRWLADTHGFGAQLPASNDDLIKDLMKAMTGSDARPFEGLEDNQLYDGKEKYVSDKRLPIVVKGGNTSAAASGANAFKFIKEELAAGEDVEFLIAWPGGWSHWVTAVGYAVSGDRLFLEVNDPDDGKTGPVDWELKPDGTFVNPKGTMLWAVSESYSPIWDWICPTGSGPWSLANWASPGFPDSPQHQAYFSGGGIVGGLGLVDLDGDRTLNALTFYNPNGSYLIQSLFGSTLHLDDGYGDGTIRHDSPMTNHIAVRVTSPQTLRIDLYDPDGTLRLAAIDAPVIRTSGPGRVVIESDVSPARTTRVIAGAGVTQFDSRQHMRELRVDGSAIVRLGPPADVIVTELIQLSLNGQIDIGRGKLLVDYTPSSPSPLQTIADAVRTAYDGGIWDGPGITSSMADANHRAVGFAPSTALFNTFPVTYAGELIDPTVIIISFTRYGDANLNGTTNIADFALLASSFNTPGDWYAGDFNYDASVSLADFALLAANFNTSEPTGLRAVPEPAAIAPAVLCPLLRRRRG